MFGRRRAPQPKGQGSAAAKQLGLFLDLDPEGMMKGMEENLDDPDLEAELVAITGSKAAAGGRAEQKGKKPLPMEDIARMADECMRDVDEDEDEDEDDCNLEDDEELLAELQEVVGEDEAEDTETISSPSATTAESSKTETYDPPAVQGKQQNVKASSAAPGTLEHTLEERIVMYKTALQNAKASGEASKARRYERGLKTLQTMLASVTNGLPSNEAEIPPPVPIGASSAAFRPAVPKRRAPPVPWPPKPSPSDRQEPSAPEINTPSTEEQSSLLVMSISPSLEELTERPADRLHTQDVCQLDQAKLHQLANKETKLMLLERQNEYKMAALTAKKQGDVEQAIVYLKTIKRINTMIETLDKGQAVDPSGLPPSPGKGGLCAPVEEASSKQSIQAAQPAAATSAPKDVLEALEQRRAKYVDASNQAKAKGDDRKARMHDRIAKQYQSVIRAHKAGKAVDFAELPVPPGFTPIPGQKATGAEHGFVAALIAADKLTSTDTAEIADEDNGGEAAVPEQPIKVPTAGQERTPSPDRTAAREELPPTAPKDVLEALEQRRAKYVDASNQAKAKGDDRKARMHDRIAKQYQSVIRAHKAGKAVDFAELPVPPGFPPIPGQKATGAEHGFVAALIAADKLTSTDTAEIADEDNGGEAAVPEQPIKVPTAGQERKRTPSPDSTAAREELPPTAPKDVLEALEQRRAKYVDASNQAKAKGDDRKARMHDRIAKQYQSVIRAHKAGKAVDFAELPVPPGFPPIPGQKATGAEHGFVAALIAADKLTSTDTAEVADEEKEDEAAVPEQPKSHTLNAPTAGQGRKRFPSASSDTTATRGMSAKAIQVLEFLEGRKKQYMRAALQAKQKGDTGQVMTLLRAAKGFDPLIEAARSGKTVDIRNVPPPPADEEEEFIMVHHSDVQVKADELYTQLAQILKEQYEKSMTHSKQFTHLGNIKETAKFENMAQDCKKGLDILKLAQSRGLPPPKHHFEERSLHTVRIFPELNSTDMVVTIVKGINLPAPSGVQANDLDAYIKFDFPYPSKEQPQKHRTAVVKNTNSPEYNQSFTLSINRSHRGFRRVVTSRGFKLELLHKAGFLRSDKPIGTAHVMLANLESQSEIRTMVEVLDGRKKTGGFVEVKVRLREPLSGHELQTSTMRWLVIDQSEITGPK